MAVPRPSARAEHGFTIIEALISAVVLVVGVLGAAGLLMTGLRSTEKTREREAATNLTRELVEVARAIPYDRLNTNTLRAELARQPGLADDATSTTDYLIARRGRTYTVEATVCVADDPADGYGKTPLTGDVCPAASSTSPAATATPAVAANDVNPEDYKRVRVTVTWKPQAGRATSMSQTSVVNNPGSSTGPRITSLDLVNSTNPVTAEPTGHILRFTATTSSKPQTVNWLLDGTVQPNAPTDGGSGLAWNFTWDITNVPDGTYIVSAEAFNRYNVSGPGRSVTVQLNRNKPATPTGATGGRSLLNPVVDLQWSGNKERDIVGYAVYRDGAADPVCPLSQSTECRDDAPPAGGSPTYRIYAYDYAPDGTLQASPTPATVKVSESNRQPTAPDNVAATFDPSGFVLLTWHRPSPEDPDTGDGIAFYRIYRDGVAVAARYDTWFSEISNPTYQDYDLKGTKHTYRVTAVDRFNAESPLSAAVGPVGP